MIREMLGIAEGILQDLHNDHNEVAALLEHIGDSENGAERSALFKEMSTKLLAHAKAEQEVLYTRMQNSPNEESRHICARRNERARADRAGGAEALGYGRPDE